MPVAQVLFHRLAASEYRSARDWYRARSVAAADRFVLAVERAVTRIESAAESLPILTGFYQYVRVVRYPYILIFRRVDNEEIMVIAVAHTSRRPEYWRQRS
jgi:plasmid stabilization system protein ParE